MTKSALAKAADISGAYVTQLEGGDRTSASQETIRKLCEALDVEDGRAFYMAPNLDELFGEINAARAREAKAS